MRKIVNTGLLGGFFPKETGRQAPDFLFLLLCRQHPELRDILLGSAKAAVPPRKTHRKDESCL